MTSWLVVALVALCVACAERTRDTPMPVRAALEAHYAQMAAAYDADDPDIVLALRTPDFSVQMPNGERWDAARSAAYVRAGFEQQQQVLHASFAIAELNVRGDTAAALIHQRWHRMQLKAGRVRRVETSACQRETWVNTAAGWRLHLIDEVQPLVWVIDGKRVDPTEPYDPDAPPYAPAVETTSQCTLRASATTTSQPLRNAVTGSTRVARRAGR